MASLTSYATFHMPNIGKKMYIILAISAAVFIMLALMPVVHATNSTTPAPNQTYPPSASVPSWFDSGSNAWMLTAATLVGLMSLPGLAIFYAGLAKKRFVVNTMLMIFYAYAVVLVLWLFGGYNFGFGYPAGLSIDGYVILGIPSSAMGALFMGSQAVVGPTASTINVPTSTIVFFQFVFAAITPGLFVGAVIERMNFKAWMVFVPLWSFFVYSPLAYWLFAGGWLNQLGAVDFSGGYVIHLSAGITALAAALAVGPRVASERRLKPNNLTLVLIGAGFSGSDGMDSTEETLMPVQLTLL